MTLAILLLCIIAGCSILTLIGTWNLVCNTAKVTTGLDAVQVDSLIQKNIKSNKRGRHDYFELVALKKSNDSLKTQNEKLKVRLSAKHNPASAEEK
jgi:hypothetical protein